MKRRIWSAVSTALLLFPAGCGPESAPTVPPATAPPELAPAHSGCFHWPAADFSPGNFAETEISLAAGDLAAEFTLRDLEGRSYTLSSLLAEKPVLLVLGSFT